ncbi:Alpha-ketoglutarate-dependent dioxygenase AlkB-like [Trypanosoma melophagium]|uniref:Alpha-ketoglutarate-dependent dioxygenase AlkB-like n=1 Tax=Trypanosoma melophagium TaxID=715481 RepID=UPI00351A5A46|nr:Alpha-ketoglutarate-dependent dioxygenase AlkB-like [Trypanosoma melophagium]
MKRLLNGAKHLLNGGSLGYLAAGEPYQPFGEEFGLTVFPEYLHVGEKMALRKGYVDVYIQKSDSIRLSDGRFQLPPLPPKSFISLIERIEQDNIVPRGWLNNQTANLYEPGDFIRAHIDNLFVYDDIFAIVSLGANALLRFVHVQNGEELDVVVPDGSLYIMSGPARYVYFHMVLPVEAQRFSIVFRRSILNSDGGFRAVTTPLGDLMPYRSTQILNTLYAKQIGGVRVTVDDKYLEKEEIGAFDTAKWVKGLHPLRDWSLLSQLDEDEARIQELKNQRFLDIDLGWRFSELRRQYKELEGLLRI